MGGASLKDCFIESALDRNKNQAITFLRNRKIETEISYLDLHQESNRLANTFYDFGVEKGDRVILFIGKSLIFSRQRLNQLNC